MERNRRPGGREPAAWAGAEGALRLMALAGLVLMLQLRAGELEILVTAIDDGDAKQTALAQGGPAAYGVHQDDAYTLLRRLLMPLGQQLPAAAADPAAAAAAATIVVDRTATYQRMLGYGAAMTDSSAAVLLRLKARNPELYAYAMARLFSPTLGAGFNVIRLPLGVSDYVATPAYSTYCDEESPTLAGFSIARDQETIIPALKDALALNPDLVLIATPWSPPAWMKTNHALGGVSPAAKAGGATCRLRPECIGLYAEYFVRYLEAYQAAGIRITAITPQNEPQFDAAAYPCMRMDEDDQIAFIRQLGPKLAEHHCATSIFVHDHNWILHPNDRAVVGGDAKLAPLDSVTAILSDPLAGPYIAGSAWHCYTGGTNEMASVYSALLTSFPGRQILTTELSGWGQNRGPWWNDVSWGLAHNWLGAELHGSSASLEWNLALDHRHGPTPRRDSQALGLVTINTDTCTEVRFEREFYAMAQLSRAARPGSTRIVASLAPGSMSGLSCLAVALADGRTAQAVVNGNPAPGPLSVTGIGDSFSVRIPGHGIVSCVW